MSPSGTGAIYDRIGKGYASTRRPDPRIAAQIRRAIGDVESLVNVGAGAGSYEPDDIDTVAVEPSSEMIAQRANRSNVVQAIAEALPFADDAFEAGLASLTIHHWTDPAAGLAEMRRAVGRRIVILTHEWSDVAAFWLVADYLPEVIELDRASFPPLDRITHELDVVEIEPVPVPPDCVDGFLAGYWARPEAYLDADVRASMSCFPRLDAGIVDAAIARLTDDLASGRWDERYGHLREAAAQDFGYRLVVANA